MAQTEYGLWIARRLGQQVRALRLAAGLTQDQVGECAGGISRPVMGRIERGKHELSLGTVERLAGALGVTVRELCAVLDERGVGHAEESGQETRQEESEREDGAAWLAVRRAWRARPAARYNRRVGLPARMATR